jgi:hypothetical protein
MQGHCNWNHSKIGYRIQTMIRIVIWMDLNVQSVCTCQVWKFLVLECSTSSEESIDYKIVIFGSIELKVWISHANRRVDSNLKMVSDWTHKIWNFIVLPDSTIPKDSNEILFAIFRVTDQKLWIFEDADQIWFQNLNWVSVLISGCHVLCSDWSIPFRVDRLW